MTNSEKHNGWTNYETWRVVAELENDSRSHAAIVRHIERQPSSLVYKLRTLAEMLPVDVDFNLVNWEEISDSLIMREKVDNLQAQIVELQNDLDFEVSALENQINDLERELDRVRDGD